MCQLNVSECYVHDAYLNVTGSIPPAHLQPPPPPRSLGSLSQGGTTLQHARRWSRNARGPPDGGCMQAEGSSDLSVNLLTTGRSENFWKILHTHSLGSLTTHPSRRSKARVPSAEVSSQLDPAGINPGGEKGKARNGMAAHKKSFRNEDKLFCPLLCHHAKAPR
jgi:hypothetical protein